jgi:hypothetical protein
MQTHEFTQQFLANERRLDLDAEADRARLAAVARDGRCPAWRGLAARIARTVRSSPGAERETPAVILGRAAPID